MNINYIEKTKKYVPMAMIILGLGFYFIVGRNLTIIDLLNYTPRNIYLGVISILLMYLLKSVSIIFPIVSLFILSGIIFNPLLSILVNIVGIIISYTYGYILGYFSGEDLNKYLMAKYPKLKDVDSLIVKNQWFFTFLIRTVGVLPMDIVSIFLGFIKIKYKDYILASVVGTFPLLLITTFMGIAITNTQSREFVIALGLRFLISIIAFKFYQKTSRRYLKEDK